MMLPEPPAPPLRLAVDREALVANWRALDRLSGKARAGAAVKANGYGLGARYVTKALAAAGCTDFFVANSAEAAEIADLADPANISILHGPFDEADAAYIAARGFSPVVNSLRQAAMWNAAGGECCDLMVDTGINRLGLQVEELGQPAATSLNVRTVLSHLASADEDSPLNERQCLIWRQACSQVNAREASIANSAGIMLGEAYHGTLTRPGLSLYGGVPRNELAQHIRQVARPQAAILQVRTVPAGGTVGYNATFTAVREMRAGVVSIGYADGYLRAWSDKGTVRAGEAVLHVIGRVSMDMIVVDLSGAPGLEEGDWVDIDYSLPNAASQSGLSQYELLTLLGRRFPR